MRLTEEEYRALTGTPPSKSKYHNQKIEYNGETFDSKKEYEYYLILKDRERRGEISDLERQKTFIIQEAFVSKTGEKIRAITYKADFTYYDRTLKEWKVLDVKGMKTEVYKLKKKLLAYRGVIIEEV